VLGYVYQGLGIYIVNCAMSCPLSLPDFVEWKILPPDFPTFFPVEYCTILCVLLSYRLQVSVPPEERGACLPEGNHPLKKWELITIRDYKVANKWRTLKQSIAFGRDCVKSRRVYTGQTPILLNAGINVCASQNEKTSFGPVINN
jgi:hypothetical protein